MNVDASNNALSIGGNAFDMITRKGKRETTFREQMTNLYYFCVGIIHLSRGLGKQCNSFEMYITVIFCLFPPLWNHVDRSQIVSRISILAVSHHSFSHKQQSSTFAIDEDASYSWLYD
ncbi:hypothetical protein TNIN_88881 [Trichonephila inaurata madagascariensis]|uniref:Uncharacterized protein n=1 Tax=Trichonephila inaurata madagascariensis TaxID=2747483 RepID=A0A8X6JD82_9ARAC|nr:hypothetical protein TNIN_88881 [Trichonephila inaurata madagascariensis]